MSARRFVITGVLLRPVLGAPDSLLSLATALAMLTFRHRLFLFLSPRVRSTL
jgi:hypothetical protein